MQNKWDFKKRSCPGSKITKLHDSEGKKDVAGMVGCVTVSGALPLHECFVLHTTRTVCRWVQSEYHVKDPGGYLGNQVLQLAAILI